MPDQVPSADGAFYDWQANLLDYLQTNYASVGLALTDLAPFDPLRTNYESARALLVPAQAQAQSARANRDLTRDLLESELRKLIKRIQASPLTSDADREALGITVASTAQSVPAPTSKPVAELENIEGLQHVLRLTDSETGKKSRPRGCVVEMRMAIVPHGQPVPASADDMEMVGVATTSKVTQAFNGADVCKTAAYAFRYTNTAGEKGPWSTIISGTIAA